MVPLVGLGTTGGGSVPDVNLVPLVGAWYHWWGLGTTVGAWYHWLGLVPLVGAWYDWAPANAKCGLRCGFHWNGASRSRSLHISTSSGGSYPRADCGGGSPTAGQGKGGRCDHWAEGGDRVVVVVMVVAVWLNAIVVVVVVVVVVCEGTVGV